VICWIYYQWAQGTRSFRRANLHWSQRKHFYSF